MKLYINNNNCSVVYAFIASMTKEGYILKKDFSYSYFSCLLPTYNSVEALTGKYVEIWL